MAIIGYHASHEQFAPSELLRYAIMAEKAGFGAINSSDHFVPWSERQGQSGFSFAWLGAAMQCTTLPYSLVCAPGQRYHPAIVAQAIATLAEMFPQRLWVAMGSGEAMNEKITGGKWPEKPERNERLLECVHVIRRLLQGETVTHYGRVTVQEAKLYTRPVVTPLMIAAAITPETAAWAATWADGLITVHQPAAKLREVVAAFKRGGGANKPLLLKVQLSYARTEEEALTGAWDQWRNNIFSGDELGDIWHVHEFDEKGNSVKPEDMYGMVHISADLGRHIDWIGQYIDMGFERIMLHNVNRQQERFIKDFGRVVLPALS